MPLSKLQAKMNAMAPATASMQQEFENISEHCAVLFRDTVYNTIPELVKTRRGATNHFPTVSDFSERGNGSGPF